MTTRIGWRALARYVAGESNPEEISAIQAWARSDRRHDDLLEATQRAWAAGEPDAPAFDTDRAWRSLAGRIAGMEGLPLGHAGRKARWRGPAIAAAGLLAAAIAFVLLPVLREPRDGPSVKTFATGSANVATIHLDDGSVVRLAPSSELRVDPAGKREAWLTGTGFFAIAKRNDEAFVVHTPAGDARVLGTRFELSSADREVRLVVFEGRVALTASGGSEIVEAGQISRAARGEAPSAARATDVRQLAPWMRGVLIFQATPLATVAREVERQFGTPIRIVDAALSQRTVSAVFENQSLETVVAALCRVADVNCELQDTVVFIKP